MTESRLLEELTRDEALYRETGGGVTFTGGEPLLQAEFVFRLLEACRALDIHSVVDTCGAAAPHVLERAAELADLVLFDLKHLDDEVHRRITGSSNREILDNVRQLARLGANLRIRFPLVPGLNDDAAHVRRLAGFVASLGQSEVDVIPYRTPAPGAYEALGRANPSAGVSEPGADAVAGIVRLMGACGVTASVVRRA